MTTDHVVVLNRKISQLYKVGRFKLKKPIWPVVGSRDLRVKPSRF